MSDTPENEDESSKPKPWENAQNASSARKEAEQDKIIDENLPRPREGD